MKITMYNEIHKIDLSKYIDKSVVTMYDRLVNEYIPISDLYFYVTEQQINNKRNELKDMIYSKYKAKKTIVNGITFDSKKEACRYVQLKLKKDKGEISNLEMQKRYELIPKQLDDKGKVLYRAVHYVADFVYDKDGQTIVEDTKGVRTADFIIKEKLMYQVYGIKITEI